MGLFSNKEKLTPEQAAEKLLQPFLLEIEIPLNYYTNGITFFCLTDKRIIGLDKITEYPKNLITSIPLSKITAVSLEKGSGLFSFGKEVTIYASSQKIKINLYDTDSAIQFFNKINGIINQ